MMLKRLTSSGMLILFTAFAVSAQITIASGSCPGRVFSASEVTKRARILSLPKLDRIGGRERPRGDGQVLVDAVLCRSGNVSDIRAVKGVSREMDEFARVAVYLVKFEPAEARWHTVSQRMRFEVHFGPNEPGIKVRTTDASERLVEGVQVIGNRRLSAKQIFYWIETLPGEPYSEEQLNRDLGAILSSGYFDKTQSRVTMEVGIRGGIVVNFYVVELPLIGEINFEGLKVERSKVIEALQKENVKLQPEAPYDPVSVKKAVRVIELLVTSTGQGNVNVETSVEHVTAQKVNITFVITPKQ